MSILSHIIIAAFEKELEAATPEIEQYMLKVLGTLGAELMQYITKKTVDKQQYTAPVQTPQSVD